MSSLFITATGTNVGKTHTTLKLIETLAKKGHRVGVFKPIETGVTTEAKDASLLLQACQRVNPEFESLTVEDITAYTFSLPSAPFCADREQKIDLKTILDYHENLAKKCDILLIEGAGGLMVPITKEYLMVHLIKDLQAKALLVTPSRLGAINDTLQSMLALRTFDVPFDWCVNIYEDASSFSSVTQPYYDAVFPNWWSLERYLEAL
jgi:dethiobiotin synthetase